MTDFTMFTAPRAFEGLHATWQRNAILSWTRLKPSPEIFLFGDEHGIADFAKEHKCTHIKKVTRNKYGTPLVSDLFRQAQGRARARLLMYSNADIIYAGGLNEAIEACAKAFEQFLLVGRRLDSDIRFEVDFKNGWQADTWAYAMKHGHYHSPRGEDYFVFVKRLYTGVPSFAVGRSAWDNWLVLDATRREVPTVDATGFVHAVHQGKSKRRRLSRDEYRTNQKVWAHNGGVRDGGYTTSTVWRLDDHGFHLKEKRTTWR